MGGAGSRILRAGSRILVRGGDGWCGIPNSPCGVTNSRARRRWVVRGHEFPVRGGEGWCGVTNSRCGATNCRARRRGVVRGHEFSVRGDELSCEAARGRCGATNSPCEAPIARAGPRMLGIAAPIGRARSRAISIAARGGPARRRSPVRGPEIRASHLRGAVRGPGRPCELSLLARPRLRAAAVDHQGCAGLSAHPARRAAAEVTTRGRAHPPDLPAHQRRWRAPLRAGQTPRAPPRVIDPAGSNSRRYRRAPSSSCRASRARRGASTHRVIARTCGRMASKDAVRGGAFSASTPPHPAATWWHRGGS